MKQTRDNTIAPGGILGRLPVAEAVLASFEGDAGMVETALLVQPHSTESEPVVVLSKPIDGVLSVRCVSEVGDTIIIADHIDVVDLVRGPVAMDPAPRNAVRKTLAVEYPEHEVTFVPSEMFLSGAKPMPGDFSGVFTVPAGKPSQSSFLSSLPNEDSSFGIVIEQSPDVGGIDVGLLPDFVHALTSRCVSGYYSQGDSMQRLIDV